MYVGACRPRGLTTSVTKDWIEFNWMPPRCPNGDIIHYMIKFTKDGTEIKEYTPYTYYRLKNEPIYKDITVTAINREGPGEESDMMKNIKVP